MKKENLQKAIDIKEEIDTILNLNSNLKRIIDVIRGWSYSNGEWVGLPHPNGLSGILVKVLAYDIIMPPDILLGYTESNISANEERIKFLETELESL